MREKVDPRKGFTLLEVLVATAILATAFVALVGLETQSLSTVSRTQDSMVHNLLMHDAYIRFRLSKEGYTVEPQHTFMKSRFWEYRVEVFSEPYDFADIPFVPVLPAFWKGDKVTVRLYDPRGNLLKERSYLWFREER